ncbi:MAG: hypothetical protein RQ752_12315 [Thermohalobaculum sp.]|nr:hypothetical protein [Thermohalobaculum sp.]
MTGGAGFRYRAHGLEILADFEVPELLPSPRVAAPDVRILRDPEAAAVVGRAAALAGAEPRDAVVMRAAPGDRGGCFTVEGLASFWVRDGGEIRVAMAPGADLGLVTLYILGSALGLVLFQRGALVLHGASVAHRGGARLFLGPSGAGKSTIAARLGQAGHPILGDDTVALWPDGGGGFAVHPSGTSFKLWRDALEAAGLTALARDSVARRIDKFYVANPRRAEDRGHRVAEILILARGEPLSRPRVEPVPLLEAVRMVAANAYRPEFIDIFGAAEPHFRQVAALVAGARVTRLIRPWDHAATPAVADLLHRRWTAEAAEAEAQGHGASDAHGQGVAAPPRAAQ